MNSVMIVEDDEILAQTLEAHLTREGFEVEVAANAFAALDRLDLRKFTVVLTDIGMPQGTPNGLSLARMVRVRDPQCRVVLMTGRVDFAQQGDSFGAQVFVKPVDLDALTAGIRKEIAAPAAPSPPADQD